MSNNNNNDREVNFEEDPEERLNRMIEARLSEVERQAAVLAGDKIEEEERPVSFAVIRALAQHKVSIAELWEEPVEILLKLFLGFIRIAVLVNFIMPIVAVILLIAMTWIGARTLVVFIGVLIHFIVRYALIVYRAVPRPGWNGFVGFWNNLIDKIITLVVPLPCGLVAIMNAIQDAIAALKIAFEKIKEFVVKAVEAVKQPFKAVGGFFKKIFRRRLLSVSYGAEEPYDRIFDSGFDEGEYETATFRVMGAGTHAPYAKMESKIREDDPRVQAFLSPGHPKLAAILASILVTGHQREGYTPHPKPIIMSHDSFVTFHDAGAHMTHRILTRHVRSSDGSGILHGTGAPTMARFAHPVHEHGIGHTTPVLAYDMHECKTHVGTMLECIHNSVPFHVRERMAYHGVRQSEAAYCAGLNANANANATAAAEEDYPECLEACAIRAETCGNGTSASSPWSSPRAPRASPATRRKLLQQSTDDAVVDTPSTKKRCGNNRHNVPTELNLGNLFKFMRALRIKSEFGDTDSDDWEWLQRMRMCGCEFFTSGGNVLEFFAQKIVGPPVCKFGKSLRRSNKYVRMVFEKSLSWALLRDRRGQVTTCENIITAVKLMANGVFSSATLGRGKIKGWGDIDQPAATFENCVTDSTSLEMYCAIWGVGFMLIFFCAVLIAASVVVAFYDLYVAIIKMWLVFYRVLILNLVVATILAANTFLVQYRYTPELRSDVLRARGLVVDTVEEAFSLVYSTDARGFFKPVGLACGAIFLPVRVLYMILKIVCCGCADLCNCCNVRTRKEQRMARDRVGEESSGVEEPVVKGKKGSEGDGDLRV